MAEKKVNKDKVEALDPEMLENIDLLLNMDVMEVEEEWETLENLEEAEAFEEVEDEA